MKQAPIFVIGNPRSGSTVFFELFSSHRNSGWLTNYEAKFPGLYCGGALRRILERKHWHVTGRKKEYAPTAKPNRIIPKRAEGYDFWTRTMGADFHRSWLWSARADEKTADKEDFIAQPSETIDGLWQSLGLEADETSLQRIESYPLQSSRNQSLASELSQAHVETIQNWMAQPLPQS